MGLVLGSGTYVVDEPSLGGLVAFGGILTRPGTANNTDMVKIEPRDAVRRKVYLAQYGLSFSVDAGAIDCLTYANGSFSVVVAPSITSLPAMPLAASAILWIEKMAQVGNFTQPVVVSLGISQERNGWKVDLRNGSVAVNIHLK